MSMKRYMNMPDNRERDVWGKPVGPRYENKDWDQLTPEEMMADFEWKSDVLATFGDEVGSDTFYQDYLFRDLYAGTLENKFGYKILLTQYDAVDENKVQKLDVEDISDYLRRNDVALSPCLFYGNWRKKSLLNYVGAFVLDIDKLRPMQLQRFFRLFDEGRLLRPTFIANSGSGVHFYYVLDKMLRCDARTHEANNLIAEEIYRCLYDDVIKKEKWVDAQRHWIGQDYRVVNSRTKLNQVSQIFKIGEIYTVDQLIAYYGIKIDPKKHYATKPMIRYAGNIAKDLGVDPPNYESAKETHQFIKNHKDEAYQVREQRRVTRKEREAKRNSAKKTTAKNKKPVTWYKNTLVYMRDHTQPGYRFSAMKALALIAYKEKVPREVFLQDLHELSGYWKNLDWKGDKFKASNVEAIERFYDSAGTYGTATSETLEEWLGYEFKRIGSKRNGRKREAHLKMARLIRDEVNGQRNKWRNNDGAPTKQDIVRAYREAHPRARKADCIRDTGLSKPTVYKWWKDGNVKTIANTEKTL